MLVCRPQQVTNSGASVCTCQSGTAVADPVDRYAQETAAPAATINHSPLDCLNFRSEVAVTTPAAVFA